MVFIFVWERIIPFASSLQNGGSERVEVHISFVLVGWNLEWMAQNGADCSYDGSLDVRGSRWRVKLF